jgi:hypothetical protein
MRVSAGLVVLAAAMLGLGAGDPAARASRQATQQQPQSVTTADIQRLQDTAYDVGADISRLRSRDPNTSDRMQGELDDIRDEVIYLKVKLRKEGSVPRTEYWNLRDRLDNLRGQVLDAISPGTSRSRTGVTPYPPPPPPPSQGASRGVSQPAGQQAPGYGNVESAQPTVSNPYEVPTGTEMDVKLQNELSSATAQVEDRFEGTTMVDLTNGGRVLIPAGSVMRGVVTSVDKATRTDRKGSLTISFDQVTVRGRDYPIRATVTQALESSGIRGEVPKIGAGAGIGAIIGGILGGVKGALAGVLIGAGGTVLATPGKDVDLPAGTVLRVTFDSPVVIR